MSGRDYLRRIITDIGDQVDDIIGEGFKASKGFSTAFNVAFTVAIKSTVIGLITTEIATIFDDLNDILKKDVSNINTAPKGDKKFKEKIVDAIQKDLAERLKTAVNQNISAPLMKITFNRAIAMGTTSLTNMIKKQKTKWREQSYEKEAIKLNDEFESSQSKTKLTPEDEKLRQNLDERVKKIKGRTTKPETYAKLAKLDLPMGDVELEAAARNLSVKLLVEFDGKLHSFGDENAKEVVVDLKDGHFLNSSDGTPIVTNDCLFRSLKDKIDMGEMTATEFRDKISDTITKDPAVRAFVADRRRKYFSDFGFYGGAKKDQKSSTLEFKIENNIEGDFTAVNIKANTDNFTARTVNGVKVNVDKRAYNGREYEQYTNDQHIDYNKAIATGMRDVLIRGSDILKNGALDKKGNKVLQGAQLFELEDFDVKTVAPIFVLPDPDPSKKVFDPKYGQPIEMILNKDKIERKLNEISRQYKKPSDVEAIKKIRAYLAENNVELNFDHVTVKSAKKEARSRSERNKGPNVSKPFRVTQNDQYFNS